MYDLIVVGAGPAGAFAARIASKAGLDVLVLEKASFPRYKPCGGALSDKAISILDFPLPDDISERTINSARVHFKGKILEGHKNYPLATLVTRSKFDNLLLEKAKEVGCSVAHQKVEGYKDEKDHVEVLTKRKKYTSKFLIISAGCQNNLKNCIQRCSTRDQYGVSVVTEIIEDNAIIEERSHGILDFYFDVDNTSYGWVFPHKGYYSVGIWGKASRLKNLKGTMIRFLKRIGFQEKCKLHGHMIPLGGIQRQISKGRILLAGDSAGFVDPFTGEGIYYALHSGQIAAETILKESSSEISKVYEQKCQREFGKDLSYALWLANSLDESREPLLSSLIKKDETINTYMEIVAAKRTYKNFAEGLVPYMIESYLSHSNYNTNEMQKILKGFLGTEVINLKIMLTVGDILRTGFKLEKGQISQIEKGGFRNPSILIEATEGAIKRIQGSKDPFNILQKEMQLGRLAIRCRSIRTKLKIDILLLVLMRLII